MFQFGSKRLKFCKELGGATRPGSLGAKAPSKSRRQRRIDYCDCYKTKVASVKTAKSGFNLVNWDYRQLMNAGI